jgi:S1-C subfamily serine protease
VKQFFTIAGLGLIALTLGLWPPAGQVHLSSVVVSLPMSDMAMDQGGTGFFVDRSGHVLTAHHVIAGCTQIDIVGRERSETATLEASSPDDDLSLLASPRSFGEPISFDPSDDVAGGTLVTVPSVANFGEAADGRGPSQILYDGMVLGDGTLRRLALAMDGKPGGGGPVIDKNGHAVGIMDSEIAHDGAAVATSRPRQVHSATRSSVAREFLRRHGIDPVEGRDPRSPRDDVLAASEVKVECRSVGSGW